MTRAAIVIASHGRPEHVRACLSALAVLRGGPYETIVVDDGSPVPYADVVGDAGPHVTILRQPNAGPAAARNRGAAATGADLVLFTDDDCRPDPDWAVALIRAHDGDEARLVGGRVQNGLEENAFSRAAQAILTYSYAAFDDFTDRLAFFTTNNLCVSRHRFLALGGFDTSYRFASEDRDFSFRWKQAGGVLVHAEDATVLHEHRLTLAGFVKQQFLYGRGAQRFHRMVAQSTDEGVALGSRWFYAGLLFHPMRHPSFRAAVTTTLIGLAHASMTAGYLAERRATGRRDKKTV